MTRLLITLPVIVMLALGSCQRPAAQNSPERGIVVDTQGRPIHHARVQFKGEVSFQLTDQDGQFSIESLVKTREADSTPGALVGAEHRVTASKVGYLINGAVLTNRPLRLQLRKLPTLDNPGYAWVDPAPDETDSQRCGNCHQAIYDQWQSGGHARSADNSRFMDLYTGRNHDGGHAVDGWGLLVDYPEGQGVCSSCHVPSAAMSELGTSDLREISGVASAGVHCDFCHKIQDVDLEAVGLNHGRFAMTLLRPIRSTATNSATDTAVHATTETGQLFFGPLPDVDRGEDSHLPLQSTSEFCASCHEGTVFGVPVYTTYTEWLRSPARKAGKQCQSCHMKPDGQMTNIAEGFGGIERDPMTLASHTLLPGGRESMLRGCLDFDAQLSHLDQGEVCVDVELRTHDVGHRVPTGFIDRHLLLVVEAFDRADRPLELVGGTKLPSAAGQQLRGLAGYLFAKRLTDPAGKSPVPFWAGGATAEDTRLQPGTTVSQRYVFSRDATRARVRLLYRRFWQETKEAKGWEDDTIIIYDRIVSDESQ